MQYSGSDKDFVFFNEMFGHRYKRGEIKRLAIRHKFLIDPVQDIVGGARVLDIAAHDGRWSCALSAAGAREVLGVEARQELVDAFGELPEIEAKARVQMVQGDLYDTLPDLVARGEQFDVIALFGILYHVMDHFYILRKCLELKPSLIIVDSEFMQRNSPYIELIREDTRKDLNAVPQIEGQEFALKGIPSTVAMERMAQALDCDLQWLDWSALPESKRGPVRDYFNEKTNKMIRKTCLISPNVA